MAVPAAPYLVTFAQPDGSAFQAYLKGDENFSWIETQNKQVLVKSKSSGFFEFALVEEDTDKRLKLLPSGIPLIKLVQSARRSGTETPKFSLSKSLNINSSGPIVFPYSTSQGRLRY